MDPNSKPSNSLNQRKLLPCLNKGLSLPYPFMELFCNPPLRKIDPIRIIGTPLNFEVKDVNGKLRTVHAVLLKDNFVFGALWGLLSGYCTKSFFLPPRKGTFMLPDVMDVVKKASILDRSKLISWRVFRQVLVAGLLFDYVEQYGAKRMNKSRTSTMSIFWGLLSVAVAFPLSNRPLSNAIYISAILGGYLIGAKLPPLIFDEDRRHEERRSK